MLDPFFAISIKISIEFVSKCKCFFNIYDFWKIIS